MNLLNYRYYFFKEFDLRWMAFPRLWMVTHADVCCQIFRVGLVDAQKMDRLGAAASLLQNATEVLY